MNQTIDPSETKIHYFDALQPESAPVESHSKSGGTQLREFEGRLDVLETAILEHATILRDRIGSRLDRLEDKLRYEASGLRKAMASEKGDRNEKIVQLTDSFTAAVDRVEMKTQASTVKATMEDLIAALAATRSHLDTLAHAVSKSRSDLPS